MYKWKWKVLGAFGHMNNAGLKKILDNNIELDLKLCVK